jgi:hypothetical protein
VEDPSSSARRLRRGILSPGGLLSWRWSATLSVPPLCAPRHPLRSTRQAQRRVPRPQSSSPGHSSVSTHTGFVQGRRPAGCACLCRTTSILFAHRRLRKNPTEFVAQNLLHRICCLQGPSPAIPSVFLFFSERLSHFGIRQRLL